MTLTQMVTRVFNVMRDSTNTFVTEAMVIDWLNDGQLDLAARLKVLRKEKTGTTSGTITLPTAPDFLEARTLRLGTDDNVEWVDDDVYWSWKDSGDAPTQTLGRIHDTLIELYPTPAASTAYALRYWALPTTMVKTSQEVCDLPNELQPRMVDFATARAWYRVGEDAWGDRHMSFYEAGLPEAPLGRTRQNPGPLFVHPQASVFDEADSMHL